MTTFISILPFHYKFYLSLLSLSIIWPMTTFTCHHFLFLWFGLWKLSPFTTFWSIIWPMTTFMFMLLFHDMFYLSLLSLSMIWPLKTFTFHHFYFRHSSLVTIFTFYNFCLWQLSLFITSTFDNSQAVFAQSEFCVFHQKVHFTLPIWTQLHSHETWGGAQMPSCHLLAP